MGSRRAQRAEASLGSGNGTFRAMPHSFSKADGKRSMPSASRTPLGARTCQPLEIGWQGTITLFNKGMLNQRSCRSENAGRMNRSGDREQDTESITFMVQGTQKFRRQNAISRTMTKQRNVESTLIAIPRHGSRLAVARAHKSGAEKKNGSLAAGMEARTTLGQILYSRGRSSRFLEA